MRKEIWKDIEGFEGLYQVSNQGRVRSLNYNNTGKYRLLKLQVRSDGYQKVSLCKNGKYKQVYVHRLVAEAFIPNPNNLPIVNHKDCNPSNNVVSNLEWCDYSYNNSYDGAGKKRREAARENNSTNSPVYCYVYNTDGEFLMRCKSMKEAAELTDTNYRNVWNICHTKHRSKSIHGLVFKI